MADARTIWKQRVRDWRASGESAERYAVGRGFAGSTLKWWASQLRENNATPIVRVAQLIRSGSDERRRGTIVVELEAGVRITIEPGADRETITTVLAIVAAPRSRQ